MNELFHIDLYNSSGTRQAILTDVHWLDYQIAVNKSGYISFEADADADALASLEPGWRVDVWRELPSGTLVKEAIGLVDELTWEYRDRAVLTVGASGLMSLLGKRCVMWKANTNNRSAFTAAKAETIAKTLVSYNIGASATTVNGRILDGVNSLISVQADAAGGNTLDWFCEWANLLETLQELAEVGGGDMDLVPVTGGYEFRWYAGQRGTDRSATLLFALERGNIANPRYVLSTVEMKNAVVVGGKGEDAERATAVVLSSEHTSATQAEMFENATDVETSDGLSDRGAAALEENKTVSAFSFDILQTEACNFGVEYVLGDLVKALNPFTNTAVTVKIESATVSYKSDGTLDIQIEVS